MQTFFFSNGPAVLTLRAHRNSIRFGGIFHNFENEIFNTFNTDHGCLQKPHSFANHHSVISALTIIPLRARPRLIHNNSRRLVVTERHNLDPRCQKIKSAKMQNGINEERVMGIWLTGIVHPMHEILWVKCSTIASMQQLPHNCAHQYSTTSALLQFICFSIVLLLFRQQNLAQTIPYHLHAIIISLAWELTRDQRAWSNVALSTKRQMKHIRNYPWPQWDKRC